jgi:hypothetical protein
MHAHSVVIPRAVAARGASPHFVGLASCSSLSKRASRREKRCSRRTYIYHGKLSGMPLATLQGWSGGRSAHLCWKVVDVLRSATLHTALVGGDRRPTCPLLSDLADHREFHILAGEADNDTPELQSKQSETNETKAADPKRGKNRPSGVVAA